MPIDELPAAAEMSDVRARLGVIEGKQAVIEQKLDAIMRYLIEDDPDWSEAAVDAVFAAWYEGIKRRIDEAYPVTRTTPQILRGKGTPE